MFWFDLRILAINGHEIREDDLLQRFLGSSFLRDVSVEMRL